MYTCIYSPSLSLTPSLSLLLLFLSPPLSLTSPSLSLAPSLLLLLLFLSLPLSHFLLLFLSPSLTPSLIRLVMCQHIFQLM